MQDVLKLKTKKSINSSLDDLSTLHGCINELDRGRAARKEEQPTINLAGW